MASFMTPIEKLNLIFSGTLIFGFWVGGLLFLRYWKTTRDVLFGWFAAAFWMLMLERVFLVIINPEDEARPYVYLVRLLAFSMLIVAVIQKNKKRGK